MTGALVTHMPPQPRWIMVAGHRRSCSNYNHEITAYYRRRHKSIIAIRSGAANAHTTSDPNCAMCGHQHSQRTYCTKNSHTVITYSPASTFREDEYTIIKRFNDSVFNDPLNMATSDSNKHEIARCWCGPDMGTPTAY